jgi:hypothetical protein
MSYMWSSPHCGHSGANAGRSHRNAVRTPSSRWSTYDVRSMSESDVQHASDHGQSDRSAPRHRKSTSFLVHYYVVGVSLAGPSSKDLWWGQRVVVFLSSMNVKLFCFTGEWVFMHAAHLGRGVSALLRTRCAGWCDSRGTIGNNGTITVLLPAANQIRHRPRDAKQRLFMRMPDK